MSINLNLDYLANKLRKDRLRKDRLRKEWVICGLQHQTWGQDNIAAFEQIRHSVLNLRVGIVRSEINEKLCGSQRGLLNAMKNRIPGCRKSKGRHTHSPIGP